MEHEKKATELTQKYFDEVTDHMTWEQAEQCSIILCDAKLDISDIEFHTQRSCNEYLAFWQSVKKVLENK